MNNDKIMDILFDPPGTPNRAPALAFLPEQDDRTEDTPPTILANDPRMKAAIDDVLGALVSSRPRGGGAKARSESKRPRSVVALAGESSVDTPGMAAQLRLSAAPLDVTADDAPPPPPRFPSPVGAAGAGARPVKVSTIDVAPARKVTRAVVLPATINGRAPRADGRVPRAVDGHAPRADDRLTGEDGRRQGSAGSGAPAHTATASASRAPSARPAAMSAAPVVSGDARPSRSLEPARGLQAVAVEAAPRPVSFEGARALAEERRPGLESWPRLAGGESSDTVAVAEAVSKPGLWPPGDSTERRKPSASILFTPEERIRAARLASGATADWTTDAAVESSTGAVGAMPALGANLGPHRMAAWDADAMLDETPSTPRRHKVVVEAPRPTRSSLPVAADQAPSTQGGGLAESSTSIAVAAFGIALAGLLVVVLLRDLVFAGT